MPPISNSTTPAAHLPKSPNKVEAATAHPGAEAHARGALVPGVQSLKVAVHKMIELPGAAFKKQQPDSAVTAVAGGLRAPNQPG